jgi:hypothetical protein
MKTQPLKPLWDAAVKYISQDLSAAWDKVSMNSVRLERGTEEAKWNHGTSGWLVFMNALCLTDAYRDMGISGAVGMIIMSAGIALALFHAQNYSEIKQHDQKEEKAYAAKAIKFYEANKDNPFIIMPT